MGVRPLVAVAILALTILAGCTSSPAEGPLVPTESLAVAAPATYTDDTGGIEGVVTDDQLAPIHLASVAFASDWVTSTDAAGRFSFSRVPPGTLDIRVTAEGYETQTRSLDVTAGAVATITFALVALPSDDSFHETIPFAGASGFCIHANATDTTPTSGRIVRGCPTGLSTLYPTQNFATVLPAWGNLSAILVETTWVPTQAATRDMMQTIVLKAVKDDQSIIIAGTAQAGMLDQHGASPIRSAILDTTLQGLVEHSNERFGADPELYVTPDWDLRVEVALMPQQSGPGASIAISQRWDLFVTSFVREPLPAHFTALPDA